MQAYILIKCKSGCESRIISEFSELEDVVEINGIWGIHDIFLKIAKRYRVEEIAKSVLKLINTWEKPEEPYIPDPAYVKEKLKEYKIRW